MLDLFQLGQGLSPRRRSHAISLGHSLSRRRLEREILGCGMKILDGRGVEVLKGVDFSDGVIEFDLLPAEKQFASMYFRWKDSLESEIFYFRTDRVGQPQAIQYAPVIGGVNCWNLFDNYQTAANWSAGVPIHTKLVV